jgi:hypothetical protein
VAFFQAQTELPKKLPEPPNTQLQAGFALQPLL